jgi:uncharacterized protein (TIGR00251 family)
MALQYCDMTDDLFDVVRRSKGRAEDRSEVVLRLSVQPGAGRSAVVGRHGDALRVRVAPPPIEDRANEATLALVAELLGARPSDVELTFGARSRQKRVRVVGVDPEEVSRRLDEAIAKATRRRGSFSGGHARS